MTPGETNLSSIQHVVVLMLENRSFDHMLGFLYSGSGNMSPAGHPFDGLSGTEANSPSSGPPVTVFKIEPSTPNAYFMPGADPGEGYMATNFTRFGVRVPAVLVSPLIAPGTVYRVPAGSTPLDHTSILKTVEQRWGLPALTARDAVAPAFGDVLTLSTPRTDDVLAGVTVPTSGAAGPSAAQPAHLQEIQAELVSRQFPAGRSPATGGTAPGSKQELHNYIQANA